MKRSILLACFLAIFLLSNPYLQAQTTYTSGNLTITDDGDLPGNVDAIITITGDLAISGTITEFPDFAALEVVEGNLLIDGITTATLTDLTNIFPALTEVKGTLRIQNNDKVKTISGFANLDNVGRGFFISNHASLTAAPSFDALTSITKGFSRVVAGVGLFIENNAVLPAIPTFSKITTTGNVYIHNNNALTAVSGFDALKNITIFSLTITDNDKLETISGFDALESIKLTFNISINDKLTTISGFSALTSVLRNFTINDNIALTAVSGFGSLTTISRKLEIQNNRFLSSCCGLIGITDNSITVGGTTTISGNAAGCNSIDEITTNCAVPEVVHDGSITIAADGQGPSNLTEITRITGNLSISGTITSFPDFAVLEAVVGNITIDNITTGTLTDLSAIFPALDSVYGDLHIQNQSVVETITGFATLDTIGENLQITDNTSLTSVSGFEALASIGGGVSLRLNANLASCCSLLGIADNSITIGGTTTISGNAAGCADVAAIKMNCLPSYTNGNLAINANNGVPNNVAAITRITGDLSISGTITNFPDFATLKVVEGDLEIDGITTSRLIDLDDIFPSLDSVRGNLSIENNNRVQTITGFATLDSIGGTLQIGNFSGNIALRTLSGFDALTRIGESLGINFHPLLTSVSGFSALISIGRNLNIGDNAVLTTLPNFDALESVGKGFIGSAQGIRISINGKLTTLPSFVALTSIRDNLFITNNTALTTVSGFTALTSVEEDISISNNAALTTVSGFRELTSVGTDVRMSNNATLTTISGFGKLESIGESLNINFHPALMSISGFSALISIGRNLNIGDNAVLTTLPDFDALESVGKGFIGLAQGIRISINGRLTTLPSFEALTSVETDVSIGNNPTLTTISGFEKLASIGRDIIITGNVVLATISGFTALTSLGGNFTVQNNTLLASCCGLLGITDNSITVGGTTTISGNAAGCSSEEEILVDCATTRALSAFSSTLTASARAGRVTFNVVGNIPWRITKNPADTWITSISPDNGTDNQIITIAYDENTDNMERMAVLMLIAADAGGEIVKITLTQASSSTSPSPPSPPNPPIDVLGLPAVDEGLRFYPNPASQTLYIEGITQETNLIIREVSGKTLLRATLRQNEAIDLTSLHQNLSQGVYLLSLQNSREQITRRLVIGW